MLSPSALLIGTTLVGQALGQACKVGGQACPRGKPCCSSGGWCSPSTDVSACILGCQPYISYNISVCAPNPICEDWSTDFREGLNRVYQGDAEAFDNDPDAYDWTILGRSAPESKAEKELENILIEQDDGTRLAAQPLYNTALTGHRLSSVRYMHYGTVDVVMQTARWQGMSTTFTLVSDNRENIRFETEDGNTTHVNATQGIEGRREFFPSSNSSLPYTEEGYINDAETIQVAGNTSAEFHKYTLDWQPEYVRWLIDDEEVRRLDKDELDTSDGNRYLDTPARIEIALRASGPYYTDPELQELEYYWMTIQSVNVRCGDSPAGNGGDNEDVTGWVYVEDSSAESPRIRATNQAVTVSSGRRKSAVTSGGFMLVLVGLVLLVSGA